MHKAEREYMDEFVSEVEAVDTKAGDRGYDLDIKVEQNSYSS